MTIQPIDTSYNGYYFRSRLEARWAVFFDQMRVPYQYELQGYELGGTRYLPDFHLPDGLQLYGEEEPRTNLWVEIKPSPTLTPEERRKLARFVKHTGYQLLLLAGEPGPKATLRLISYQAQYVAPHVRFIELRSGSLGLLDLTNLSGQIPDPETRHAVEGLARTQPLLDAYDAARQERFEEQYRSCRSCGRSFKPYRDYHALCPDCFQAQYSPSPTPHDSAPIGEPRTAIASAPQVPSTSSSTRTRYFAVGSFLVLALLALASGIFRDSFRRQPPPASSFPTPLATEPVLAPTQAVPAAAPARSTVEPTAPLTQPTLPAAACVCDANVYNCVDFETQAEAQACFDACYPIAGDIHILDQDADLIACELLP